jgi:hypothetical protein
MTDIYNLGNLNLFATHAGLTAGINRDSFTLDRMERAGLSAGDAEYDKVESDFWELWDRRAALEGAYLASPLGGKEEAGYRSATIARLSELEPERGSELYRRLDDQIEALAA